MSDLIPSVRFEILMTVEDFLKSAESEPSPPAGITPELESLWHTKRGNWEAAHDIAQDIPTKMGSWIHGLLHAIEGDFGNAGYWYRLAGEPPISAGGIEAELTRLVECNLPVSD